MKNPANPPPNALDKAPNAAALYKATTFPCPGEAHSPEVAGNIDNCGICAPEWGRIPIHKALSTEARWLLLAIAETKRGFLPTRGAPSEAVEELVREFEVARLSEHTFRRTGFDRKAVQIIELTDLGYCAALEIVKSQGKILR
jgi:hypothetical protein